MEEIDRTPVFRNRLRWEIVQTHSGRPQKGDRTLNLVIWGSVPMTEHKRRMVRYCLILINLYMSVIISSIFHLLWTIYRPRNLVVSLRRLSYIIWRISTRVISHGWIDRLELLLFIILFLFYFMYILI